MAIEIKAPTFPESVADGTVATWHKKPGEAVKRDELIVDIETDKVVLEVLATADGVLGDIVKGEGDTATPSCPTKCWVRSLKAALPPLHLLLPRPLLLRLPLLPMLAKTTRSLHRPRASWLKKTASTWLPWQAPVKAVASPRKTWLLLLPTRSRLLPLHRLPSLPLLPLPRLSSPLATVPRSACR